MDAEHIRNYISALDASIEGLSGALDPVLRTSLDDKIAECQLPQERIKIYNNHLYVTISVLYSYIKTLGINTNDHPIMEELKRIKEFMKQAKEVEESLKNKEVEDLKSKDNAKDFLQRTLGTTGAAVLDSMKSPAISSENFKGAHTKFADQDNEDADNDAGTKQNEVKSKIIKSQGKAVKLDDKISKPKGRVTKPKGKKGRKS